MNAKEMTKKCYEKFLKNQIKNNKKLKIVIMANSGKSKFLLNKKNSSFIKDFGLKWIMDKDCNGRKFSLYKSDKIIFIKGPGEQNPEGTPIWADAYKKFYSECKKHINDAETIKILDDFINANNEKK